MKQSGSIFLIGNNFLLYSDKQNGVFTHTFGKLNIVQKWNFREYQSFFTFLLVYEMAFCTVVLSNKETLSLYLARHSVSKTHKILLPVVYLPLELAEMNFFPMYKSTHCVLYRYLWKVSLKSIEKLRRRCAYI